MTFSRSFNARYGRLNLGAFHPKSAMFLLLLIFISFNNFADCVFNAEEIKLVSYEIDILNVPVKAEKVLDSPVLHMTSKFGQQYQCQLPEPLVSEDKGDESGEPEIPNVTDLLEPLSSAACLLKVKDWWTYEFCYGKYIRQYHIEDSQISGAILTLGVYDSTKSVEKRSVHEENSRLEQNRYHSQQYVNGSKCDLTGTLRSSELRFFCEPDSGDYIARVDEPETCHYIVTIYTSRVCSHPHLKPLPSIKPHTILCNPVLPEEHYSKYLQKVEAEKEILETEHRKWLAEQKEKLEELKIKFQERKDEFFSQLTAAPQGENLENEEIKIENVNEDKIEEESLPVVNEDGGWLLEDLKNEEATLSSFIKERIEKQQSILQQLNTIKEGQQLYDNIINAENKDPIKAARTLDDIISKLTQAEKEIALNTGEIKKGQDAINTFQKKIIKAGLKGFELEKIDAKDILATVLEDEEDEIEEDDDEVEINDKEINSNMESDAIDPNSEPKVLDENSVQSSSEEEVKSLNTLEDGKVRVRIRRVNSDSSKSDGKLQWFRHKGLDAGQKQKLEDAVKEKLEEAGLDTSGRHIEVKIITAGYYDDEDGKDFHVLSDEETQQFQSMILTLLTRNQEARKEMDRHRKLEQNYQFKWSDDGIELQDPNEDE